MLRSLVAAITALGAIAQPAVAGVACYDGARPMRIEGQEVEHFCSLTLPSGEVVRHGAYRRFRKIESGHLRNVESGQYWQGERIGGWWRRGVDGNRPEETRYAESIPNGVWREWGRNGELRARGAYREGVREGPWRGWRPDGVFEEASYVGGVPNGAHRTWHAPGRLASEEFWVDWRRHGVARRWDRNGRVVSSVRYVRGNKEGLEEVVTRGSRRETPYRNGRRSGVEREWFEPGDGRPGFLMAERIFRDDRVHETTSYDGQGGRTRWFERRGELGDGVQLTRGRGRLRTSLHLVAEEPYRAGRREGLATYYHAEDIPYARVEYRADEPSGHAVFYYRSGAKAIEGLVLGRVRETRHHAVTANGLVWQGARLVWSPEGELKCAATFDAGKPVLQHSFEEAASPGEACERAPQITPGWARYPWLRSQ